jgi:hypothetical protein
LPQPPQKKTAPHASRTERTRYSFGATLMTSVADRQMV